MRVSIAQKRRIVHGRKVWLVRDNAGRDQAIAIAKLATPTLLLLVHFAAEYHAGRLLAAFRSFESLKAFIEGAR